MEDLDIIATISGKHPVTENLKKDRHMLNIIIMIFKIMIIGESVWRCKNMLTYRNKTNNFLQSVN